MSKKVKEEVVIVVPTIETKVELIEPEILKENECFLPTLGLVKLKPTKLKYFKSNQYNNCMIIKNIGISEILKYQDGETIIIDYLEAVLDMPKEQITFIDEMNPKMLLDIIDKCNKLNEIKDEDFLAQLNKLEVNKNQD